MKENPKCMSKTYFSHDEFHLNQSITLQTFNQEHLNAYKTLEHFSDVFECRKCNFIFYITDDDNI